MYNIAVIVGSLRQDSFNLKLAKALAKLGEKQFKFHFLELHDLPMYNEDLWVNAPAAVLRLKDEIRKTDAVLFVTPEYNRSIPAVVKNVIDWGSRPYGEGVWANKPCAMTGTSPGNIGTAVAQAHLRHTLSVVGAVLMGLPEVYFVFKPELFDVNDNINDEKTKQFLANYLENFAHWIKKII